MPRLFARSTKLHLPRLNGGPHCKEIRAYRNMDGKMIVIYDNGLRFADHDFFSPCGIGVDRADNWGRRDESEPHQPFGVLVPRARRASSVPSV